MERTPAFSLESLDFFIRSRMLYTGKMLHYVMRYGAEVRALRTVCIDSVKLGGPLLILI